VFFPSPIFSYQSTSSELPSAKLFFLDSFRPVQSVAPVCSRIRFGSFFFPLKFTRRIPFFILPLNVVFPLANRARRLGPPYALGSHFLVLASDPQIMTPWPMMPLGCPVLFIYRARSLSTFLLQTKYSRGSVGIRLPFSVQEIFSYLPFFPPFFF